MQCIMHFLSPGTFSVDLDHVVVRLTTQILFLTLCSCQETGCVYRNSFNSSQVPHKGMDELVCHFKTASEGSCPSHVVVICNGFLFKINLFSSTTGTFVKIYDEQLVCCFLPKIFEHFEDPET